MGQPPDGLRANINAHYRIDFPHTLALPLEGWVAKADV